MGVTLRSALHQLMGGNTVDELASAQARRDCKRDPDVIGGPRRFTTEYIKTERRSPVSSEGRKGWTVAPIETRSGTTQWPV